MRTLILLFMITTFQRTLAQSFDEYMDIAEGQIKAEEYQKALSTFLVAFKKKQDIGKYDYANAMVVAIKCKEVDLALKWFKEGYKLNLGNSEEEITYFKTDPVFDPIRDKKPFREILKKMECKHLNQKEKKLDEDRQWKSEIEKNRIERKEGEFENAPHGFALYYSDYEKEKIPYLVYVPKTYDPSLPSRTLIFLHGGVMGNENFLKDDSQIKLEPIFGIADNLNLIVIYPFAKRNFGWVDNRGAFDNIFNILNDVCGRYAVNKNQIYLGGVSDGGNATFWFASQKETLFRAFFTFSAKPKLPSFESSERPFKIIHPTYSLHAEDDSIYKYDIVKNIYQHRDKLSKWN